MPRFFSSGEIGTCVRCGFRAGATFGALLGGAVITESVFNLQGLGRFAVTSIHSADLYALVDVTLIAAFFVAENPTASMFWSDTKVGIARRKRRWNHDSFIPVTRDVMSNIAFAS